MRTRKNRTTNKRTAHRYAQRRVAAKGEMLEEIAANALLAALDSGAQTAAEVQAMIEQDGVGSGEVYGFSPEEVIEAYLSAWRSGSLFDNAIFNVEFDWSFGRAGDMYELLLLGAVYYIAKVASKMFQADSHSPRRNIY